MKIVPDPKCSFGCNEHVTIEHILWECVHTQTLLMGLDQHLENIILGLGVSEFSPVCCLLSAVM